jgi:hypothetical protein
MKRAPMSPSELRTGKNEILLSNLDENCSQAYIVFNSSTRAVNAEDAFYWCFRVDLSVSN